VTDTSPVSGGDDGHDETDAPAAREFTDDDVSAILAGLPLLARGERFRFRCHPDVRCFNACCTDLNLVLSPYDVLRLRRRLGMSSDDFDARHADHDAMPNTGFPFRRLRMRGDPAQSCPFVRADGCSVYADRPGACRTYPLARAAQVDGELRVIEELHILREEHCCGFAEDGEWTGESWLADQGAAPYNTASDRYLALVAAWERRGAPLDVRQQNLADLALYRMDRFQDFLRESGFLDRVELDARERQAVLGDEETALEFAFEWLSLVLLGRSDRLRPRS
jgi:Fe-S-cluster containining protein